MYFCKEQLRQSIILSFLTSKATPLTGSIIGDHSECHVTYSPSRPTWLLDQPNLGLMLRFIFNGIEQMRPGKTVRDCFCK